MRARAWTLVAALAWLGCAPPISPAVEHMSEMQFRLGAAEAPLEGREPGWRRVSMPDFWNIGRRARSLEGWYRAEIPGWPAEQTGDPRVLYLPGFTGHVTLYWNGSRIGDSGPYREEDTQHARGPQLVEIPEALVADVNVLQIRFRATEAVTDYLRGPYVGPRSLLQPAYQRQRIASRLLPLAFAAAAVGLALVLLVVHWRDPEVPYANWLTAGLLANSLASAGIYASLEGVPAWLVEPLRPALFHLAVPCYVMAIHRVRGVGSPRLERWLLGVWAAFALTIFVVPPLFVFSVAVVWMIPTLLATLYLAVQLVRVALELETARAVVLAIPLVVAGSFVLHDLYGLLAGRLLSGQLLSIYVTGMVTASLFILHLTTSRAALVESRALNRELDARVAEKGEELERNFEHLRAAEREQAVTAERERMLRDMHDGLGSQLVSTLAMVESGKFEPDDLADALRDTLDDLRLMVHSIDPAEEDLVSMLAVVRERIEPRLARRGLRFEWNVADVPDLPALEPGGVLHILRIVQEVLTNIVKHAEATTITLETGTSCAGAEREVFLSIRDDGVGLPDAPRFGRGIANMRERAAAVGGVLELAREPLGGTRMTLRLPLA